MQIFLVPTHKYFQWFVKPIDFKPLITVTITHLCIRRSPLFLCLRLTHKVQVSRAQRRRGEVGSCVFYLASCASSAWHTYPKRETVMTAGRQTADCRKGGRGQIGGEECSLHSPCCGCSMRLFLSPLSQAGAGQIGSQVQYRTASSVSRKHAGHRQQVLLVHSE